MLRSARPFEVTPGRLPVSDLPSEIRSIAVHAVIQGTADPAEIRAQENEGVDFDYNECRFEIGRAEGKSQDWQLEGGAWIVRTMKSMLKSMKMTMTMTLVMSGVRTMCPLAVGQR